MVLVCAGALFWLSGCQTPPPPPPQTSSASRTVSIAPKPSRQTIVPVKPATQTQDSQQDIVGNLIDQIEQDSGRAILSQEEQLTEQDQLLLPLVSDAPATMDDEQTSKALDAALDLLKQKTKPPVKPQSDFCCQIKAQTRLE